MTKYIHILNFKVDEVASEEEAREVGVRLMIQNIKQTSKYILIGVTDEPIDPRESYKFKFAHEKEEKVHKPDCKCCLCDVVNALEEEKNGTNDRTD